MAQEESERRLAEALDERLRQEVERLTQEVERLTREAEEPRPHTEHAAYDPSGNPFDAPGNPSDPSGNPSEAPIEPGSSQAVPPDPSNGPLDINQMTVEDLRGLKLSLTQAKRLIDYRDQVGGFTSLHQLDAVAGLPMDVRADLKRRLGE